MIGSFHLLTDPGSREDPLLRWQLGSRQDLGASQHTSWLLGLAVFIKDLPLPGSSGDTT